jgi:hypothetical protein
MEDPLPTFSYLISEIKRRWPDLAYIHVIEPRANEMFVGIIPGPVDLSGTNDPFRDIWAPRPFISCGAYSRESGIKTAEEKGDIVAYGRPFIANVSSLCIPRYSAQTFPPPLAGSPISSRAQYPLERERPIYLLYEEFDRSQRVY